MKKNLFVFAIAAMALASCNNDDSPNVGGGNNEGELVESITVSFKNSTSTYAADAPVDGVGTENNVYVAYVFARENNPEHTGALVGDWTVREVKNTTTAGDPIGSDQLQSLATFKGVRQGDKVYIIANDKTMTLPIAEALARKGTGSEDAIKAYTAKIVKDDLAELAVEDEKTQGGQFLMTGSAIIPTNPTAPGGSTIKVPVGLEREYAKVRLTATVTADQNEEAYGKVQINSGDGFIVVRIPQSVSPFTTKDRDWYFPLNPAAGDHDWDVSWLTAFPGDQNSAPNATGTGNSDYFNHNPITGAKEFRFTWDTNSAEVTTEDLNSAIAKIETPFFYVTPSYTSNIGCAEVICTQATYIGPTTLKFLVTQEIINEAVDEGNLIGPITSNYWDTDSNVKALYDFMVAKYPDLVAGMADHSALVHLEANDKVYYRADIADYQNGVSARNTERNTYYNMRATITSLGANSLQNAITSDQINMAVEVSVKKWNVSLNIINM